jgi:hypothetical protein
MDACTAVLAVTYYGTDYCCEPNIGLIVGLVVGAILLCFVLPVCCCYQQKSCCFKPSRAGGFVASVPVQAAPVQTLVQAAPVQAASPQIFNVICPEGVMPGSKLSVVAPSGQTVEILVPAGIKGGQQFAVSAPAAPVHAVPAVAATVAVAQVL